MHGSLALKNGVLYVGNHAKTARVDVFDLDGHSLEGGFLFRDERSGQSAATSLAVDDDHRVWVADDLAGRVRAFTLFGRPVADVGDDDLEEPRAGGDRRGTLGRPRGLAVRGSDDDLLVAIASGGRRRHALQWLHPSSARVRSLRPEGNPRGRFHDLAGIAWRGEDLLACEAGAERVQVFRGGHFHFHFQIPTAGGVPFLPAGAALLDDGRAILACAAERASALLLVDRAGRLLRVVAEGGSAPGQVDEPADVVVHEEGEERRTRVVAIDREGERVQVFTLDGRCYGAFGPSPGSSEVAYR